MARTGWEENSESASTSCISSTVNQARSSVNSDPEPTPNISTNSYLGEENLEDVSDNEITYIKTTTQTQKHPCPGYILHFPPGQTPHTNYPHGLHDIVHPPWNYACQDGTMVLHASSCAKTVRGAGACQSCAALGSNKTLIGIKHRLKHGVHENAPFAYHGHGGMVQVARRKTRQNDYQRVRKLNTAKKLAGKVGKVDEYKKMVLALVEKRIPRLNRLLRAAQRSKMGLHAIIELIK